MRIVQPPDAVLSAAVIRVVETRSELVVLIRNRDGRILGQIDIDSHTPATFGPEEEQAVRQVARELGVSWPDR